MPVLFLIVFVDLVGFGLLIPLLPFYVQRLGQGPEVITAVLGLYSLAQFVAAPVWGRLSDRFGRKPVLAITSFGFAVSYVILAGAHTLGLLILSRVFGGLMAGNISTAQAYVSDVTTPENRARGMGLIGAALGLGFVFGPAIGGVLGGAELATADYVAPALAAAALTTLAAVGAVLFLKESLPADKRARSGQKTEKHRYFRFRFLAGRRVLIMLTIAAFLVTTGWAQFETVFALWANARFDYGPRQIGFVLTFMGLLITVIQAGLIGRLTRAFSERWLAVIALVFLFAGYLMLPYVLAVAHLFVAAALLALGSALFTPTISSLVSKQAKDHERGTVLGLYQSAATLGRVVGPALSGVIYARLGEAAPYQVAAVLLLPVAVLILTAVRRSPEP